MGVDVNSDQSLVFNKASHNVLVHLFQGWGSYCDVDMLSGYIKEVLLTSTKKVLGCPKVKKQPWVH